MDNNVNLRGSMEVHSKPELNFEALQDANVTGIPPVADVNPLNNPTTLESQTDPSLVEKAK